MGAIDRIEKFIFETSLCRLVLVIILLTTFKTGVWYIPNLSASQSIALNPFENPFNDPSKHYIFWSWLGPFLAWLIGATGKWQFFFFHLFFSVAFTFLFIKVIFNSLPNDLARMSLILFSCLPVSATAYFWVGLDSITLFLMMLALAFPSSLVFIFIVGVLLGMQHFELGFFSIAGLLFATSISHLQRYHLVYSWNFCFVFLLGIISGKFLLILLFNHYFILVNSGRMYWLSENINYLLKNFFFHFHYIIWSVLGLGWFVALRFTDWGYRSLPFFITLSCLCLLLVISDDQTRVLAIVTFPLVTAYWLLNKNFLENLMKREITLLFTAWALMPWGWVWSGNPKWSVFPHDIIYLLHNIFGLFSVPADLANWPFL